MDAAAEFPVCQRLQSERGFSGIDPEHVLDILPYYRDWIAAAMARGDGEFSWLDMVQMLVEGNWQLWVTPSCFCITEVRDLGQFRVCALLYGGGDLEDMKACVPGIMEWARELGCARIYVEGRPGWGRALKELGAKLRYHAYTIDLEG